MEIKLEGITKEIEKSPIINGINMVISDGECNALVGPNGAGKTTLIRILLGMYNYNGSITFGGIKQDRIDVIKEKIMFILDNSNLFYKLTIRENLEFYVRAYLPGIRKNKIDAIIDELLEKIELKEYANKKITALSRGMRQRLCIGRTMITKPTLLILDEPYLGLDVEAQLFLTDYLLSLKKAKTTILISSHDLEHVEKICDTVAFIKKGKIIDKCTLTENRMETVEDMYKRIILGR